MNLKMNKKNTIYLIIVIILIAAGIYLIKISANKISNSNTNLSLITEITYLCKNDKTINATFYEGEQKQVNPGEPPIPTGVAEIELSDGRKFDLPQTISADGARYTNTDESFIFWSKGNGALILENNTEKDYVGCILIVKDPGGLSKTYLDSEKGFSIRYPENYSINTSYIYEGLGPKKDINGVKFTIPNDLSSGTNLSSYDTGVSIEAIPNTENCDATLFLDTSKAETINENNKEYSFAKETQGAAGNFYEESVWALSGTNSCIGIRYLIHYMNTNNYPQGTISEFNKKELLNQFDKIRQSLITL